jgi:hypothetical protein
MMGASDPAVSDVSHYSYAVPEESPGVVWEPIGGEFVVLSHQTDDYDDYGTWQTAQAATPVSGEEPSPSSPLERQLAHELAHMVLLKMHELMDSPAGIGPREALDQLAQEKVSHPLAEELSKYYGSRRRELKNRAADSEIVVSYNESVTSEGPHHR